MSLSTIFRHGLCRLLVPFLLLMFTPCTMASESAPGVSLKDIDTITILPIVFPADASAVQRAEPLDVLYGTLDDYIYKALLRKLALKGYVLDKPRGWKRPADWTVETLKPLAARDLAARMPVTASFGAFLFVEQVAASNQWNESSATAVISATILHRDSGTVMWRRGSEGEFHETIFRLGLFGKALTPDKHAAVEKAFSRLFADFSEKPYP